MELIGNLQFIYHPMYEISGKAEITKIKYDLFMDRMKNNIFDHIFKLIIYKVNYLCEIWFYVPVIINSISSSLDDKYTCEFKTINFNRIDICTINILMKICNKDLDITLHTNDNMYKYIMYGK